MKLTVMNVGRFWKRLMFPPVSERYHLDRLSLRMDMPWEPWLHRAVWLGTILVLIFGEREVVPPVDGLDWYWIPAGLISPTLGFFSVWVLANKSGRPRYVAIWTRMIADFGLASAIVLYQLERIAEEGFDAVGEHGILANIVLTFAAWFTFTLVWRDIKFSIATEKLAASIYYNVRGVRMAEWAEWVDDAS